MAPQLGQRTSTALMGPVIVKVCLISIVFFGRTMKTRSPAMIRKIKPVKKSPRPRSLEAIMKIKPRKIKTAESKYAAILKGPLTIPHYPKLFSLVRESYKICYCRKISLYKPKAWGHNTAPILILVEVVLILGYLERGLRRRRRRLLKLRRRASSRGIER